MVMYTWFEIPVYDVVEMQIFESLEDLLHDSADDDLLDKLVRILVVDKLDVFGQGLPLDQLHYQIDIAFGLYYLFEYYYVFVVELSHYARLRYYKTYHLSTY